MASVVAGIVIETLDASQDVKDRVTGVYGIRLEGEDERGRLAGVWEGPDGQALEHLAERMIRSEDQILGVYPVYVGVDE